MTWKQVANEIATQSDNPILGHPYFFNQLSTGLDIVSLAGEWLTATANTNMFTYEIAPVFILMENECLARMREIIGFQGHYSMLLQEYLLYRVTARNGL